MILSRGHSLSCQKSSSGLCYHSPLQLQRARCTARCAGHSASAARLLLRWRTWTDVAEAHQQKTPCAAGVVAGAGGGVHCPAERADDGGHHGAAHEHVADARVARRPAAAGHGGAVPADPGHHQHARQARLSSLLVRVTPAEAFDGCGSIRCLLVLRTFPSPVGGSCLPPAPGRNPEFT